MIVQAEKERSEHGKRQENESESFLPCPNQPHCDQRKGKYNHDDEDRARKWKSNAQFTVRKTVRDVYEQVSHDDGGGVLRSAAHPHRLHQHWVVLRRLRAHAAMRTFRIDKLRKHAAEVLL